MSGFKFESEFKIVSEALRRFDDEYRENKQKKKACEIADDVDRSFFTYSQSVEKYIIRAEEANLEKKEECLAYLNYTLDFEIDTLASSCYEDIFLALNRMNDFLDMRPVEKKISGVRKW